MCLATYQDNARSQAARKCVSGKGPRNMCRPFENDGALELWRRTVVGTGLEFCFTNAEVVEDRALGGGTV